MYRYCEHPSTEVLIACWAIGDGPVRVYTKGQPVPLDLLRAVQRGLLLGAHNADFERTVWNTVLRRQLNSPPGFPTVRHEQLDCTAARAAMCGLPRALDGVGAALNLDLVRKDKRGAELIRFFCKPRKPSKRDGRTRNHPRDYPEKFSDF